MRKYLKQIFEEVTDEFDGVATSPVANHLFDVNDDCENLSEEKAIFFHHIVYKLLFLCKRGRPDIQTAIAFLTTRVKCPDKDDLKKLYRVIKYLRSTSELVLTLECDESGNLQWWVDASFAVHHDMKSHTGGVMSLGKGAIYSCSTKQKLNTKISTESELVGIDDVMPMILWMRYFLEAQGFVVNDNIVYQDNMSTMKLAENGRKSMGKRSRHINIRYFFVTDRLAAGDISIKYCPTEKMVADFYTKPLQGKLFRMFRNLILNCVDTKSERFYKPAENSKTKSADTPIKAGVASQECVRKTLLCKNNIGTYENETRSIVKDVRPNILAKLVALQKFKSNDT